MRDYVRTSYVARVRVARVMSVSVYDVIIRELLMYRRSLWCRTIALVYARTAATLKLLFVVNKLMTTTLVWASGRWNIV